MSDHDRSSSDGVTLLESRIEQSCVEKVFRGASDGFRLTDSDCSLTSPLTVVGSAAGPWASVEEIELSTSYEGLSLAVYAQLKPFFPDLSLNNGAYLRVTIRKSSFLHECEITASLSDLAMHLSSLLSSSIGRSYVSNSFFLISPNNGPIDPDLCVYMQFYPKERANPLALPRMLSFFGVPSADQRALGAIVNSTALHDSHWYQFHFSLRSLNVLVNDRISTRSIASVFSCRSIMPQSWNISEKMLQWVKQRQHSEIDPRTPSIRLVNHEMGGSGLETNEKEVVLDRRTLDSATTFTVQTHLEFPIAVRHLLVQEPLPFGYSVLFHTFSFSLFRQAYIPSQDKFMWEPLHNDMVVHLPTFRILGKECMNPTSASMSCMPSVSFDFDALLPNLTANLSSSKLLLQLQFSARKHFPSISALPPDASFGTIVFPAVIAVGNDTHVLQSLVVRRPIPDASMPYNVITIVSTLMAFLLGSLINAWNKKRCD